MSSALTSSISRTCNYWLCTTSCGPSLRNGPPARLAPTESATRIRTAMYESLKLRPITCPKDLIDRALQLGRPTVCEYARDKPLTLNLLWDIAYSIHKESLRLDTLEDFNATEADIMRLKESILSTWKSRDARKTSSLGPTFVSSADSRSRESTLGKTFTPRQPAPFSSVPRGPGGGGDAIIASPSVFKPLAPPPGIPTPPGLSHYLQDPMPASFPAMGQPREYNFDPITGRPLRASTPDVLSRFSQSRDASLLTPVSPRVTSLSDLLRSSEEERPLVVGSASHSSRVVTGERMQITTVFPSAADTTLSSSATTAPRISTSSSNVVEGDVRRVIRRDQAPSPNKVLAGSGVGRGTAMKPVRQSTGRGQGLVAMLADSARRVGRGRSAPSPPVGRSGPGERRTDTGTETGPSPAVTMHLDRQGPAVTYSEAASRPPRKTDAPSPKLTPGDVRLKLAAREKEKEAARATLERIRRQEREEDAARKKREEQELRRARRRGVMRSMEREGARRQEEYNRDRRASGACPDPITDPLGWCEHEWSKEGKHHQSPVWAGDLWSASPMHHQQLAAKMVCSWKLVKAYQRTRQSSYICPPAPHVLEAFNHKVNHDTHKELGAQERAVLQYARALQYVSYCNDERYKDQVAPAVKAFWDEVAEPFGSRALRNLDLSHVVGRAMHPNRAAKIPDYGVRDHIALTCGPFFASVESRSQYEARRRRREEERGRVGASSSHRSPSRDLERSRERDREPPAPKANRARSKHRSASRKRALSRTPRGGSPRDSSSSRGRKLPTPPRPSRKETSKRAGSPPTACTDDMEVARSPPLSWEERVQEEEDEKDRHSSIGGDSQPCPSPVRMEGCSVSDVSMAEEGLQQGDSDVVVEEEVEENMETDEHPNVEAPAPTPDKAIPETSEPEAEDDRRSHVSEESTDQNPPHDSDLDEDELLGPATDVSVPGGHSDDSVALVVSPKDDDLYE